MTQGPSATLDRREALRRVALLLGGAVSAPAVAGVLAGCDSAPRPSGGAASGAAGSTAAAAWTPRALRGDEVELVATIAEHIIPETDTPGARGAGVHRFIDTMLAEFYPAAEAERFRAGLAELDARARRESGKPFLRCEPAAQRALLERVDRETFAAAPAAATAAPRPSPDKATERGAAGTPPGDLPPRPAPPPFFRTMKELTLLGYYTSQPGMTRELRHAPVPGRFEGCVPLAKGDRAWAV